MTLRLEVVSPEGRVFTDDVDMVVVPGIEGELGILPHHTPLVSLLGMGELKIRKGGDEESFAIVGGFLQVGPDKVVVMAETADMASEMIQFTKNQILQQSGTAMLSQANSAPQSVLSLLR